MLEGIHWLGHASFQIKDGVVIYIDPWKLQDPEPADLILITHGHFDHLSLGDIAQIATENSMIMCPASCLARISAQVSAKVRSVAPGQVVKVGDVTVEAVPSYNTDKPNHPRKVGNLGYVVAVNGRRIYHAGDTDLIPEMESIRCDVALLPVGGTYTMNVDEAVQALERIRPRVAVPMHYGDIVGSAADGQRFKEKAPAGVEVVVLEHE